MVDDDWGDLQMKAASTVRFCLTDDVLWNVLRERMASRLWSKLESLYMPKQSTRLFLKMQLYGLKMEGGILRLTLVFYAAFFVSCLSLKMMTFFFC